MLLKNEIDFDHLRLQFLQLRGDLAVTPSASIIIPVNAQGDDLEYALQILADIARYRGKHSFEVILNINNYPTDTPPPELESYGNLGIRVIGIPNVKRPDEKVWISARMAGVKIAASGNLIFPDADERIANPTEMLDWFVEQLNGGAQLAYARVTYYDLADTLSLQVRIMIHHLANTFKRIILGIPTARGGSYAFQRSTLLQLYEKRMLYDDINVGPAVKSIGGKVVYSGAFGSDKLTILTSGRKIESGWLPMINYLRWRWEYNFRVLRRKPKS
ncbi:hypothetical protein ANRL3_00817 [Anaerolineae bacterium]|nr:hypothetical protein ANRL3_00817 [Anaerolineae bacterium]